MPPSLIDCTPSKAVAAAKAQHEPHEPWFLTSCIFSAALAAILVLDCFESASAAFLELDNLVKVIWLEKFKVIWNTTGTSPDPFVGADIDKHPCSVRNKSYTVVTPGWA